MIFVPGEKHWSEMPIYFEHEIWVCPQCGVIDEGDMLEGHDGRDDSLHDHDGYTGEFFCGGDHPGGVSPKVVQHSIYNAYPKETA